MTRRSGLARAHGTHGMTRDPFLLMYSWQMRKCTPKGAWAPVIVPSDVTSALLGVFANCFQQRKARGCDNQ